MRFVPANCLREGMKLGQTVYGRNEERLLIAGTTLTSKYIKSISKMMLNGLYIDDDISKDIEIKNVISEELRSETTKCIRSLFVCVEKDTVPVNINSISNRVENIVEELLQHKNMMVNMIDLKVFDDYTYSHSVNVAVLSIIVGVTMGLNKKELTKLGLGALLHDIGKVFIDKDIINKPGKLTSEEFDSIKMHSKLGYEYVRDRFQLPVKSYIAVLDHHERYDGSGYPNKKMGDEISDFGKMVALADVYDALTSERPYRKALPPSEAMEYIMGNSQVHFDPELVDVFAKKVAPYPIGTLVRLSNGMTGLVVENYEAFCLRPKVRIIRENGKPVKLYEIDLKEDPNYMNVIIEGIDTEASSGDTGSQSA